MKEHIHFDTELSPLIRIEGNIDRTVPQVMQESEAIKPIIRFLVFDYNTDIEDDEPRDSHHCRNCSWMTKHDRGIRHVQAHLGPSHKYSIKSIINEQGNYCQKYL